MISCAILGHKFGIKVWFYMDKLSVSVEDDLTSTHKTETLYGHGHECLRCNARKAVKTAKEYDAEMEEIMLKWEGSQLPNNYESPVTVTTDTLRFTPNIDESTPANGCLTQSYPEPEESHSVAPKLKLVVHNK